MSEQPTLTPEILVPRIGDYLVEKGLLRQEDLINALQYQSMLKQKGENPPLLGQILVQKKYIERATLDQAVTEQIIQLRTALVDANQQLEKRVQERTAELEMALKQLSELNQLKSNFVANISHELRTPLTHLTGYMELLGNQDLGPLSEDQYRAVQTMRRATDRLQRLIEDLIMFSISDREQVTLKIQPFNICQICQKVVDRSLAKAVENHIVIDLFCSNTLPAVNGDEEKIFWVLLQLIDNAIKFSPNGGKIFFRVEQEDQFIRVTVADTGIGIANNRINEIFQPFHQLDSSSTRRFGGTGLGLALVKNILEAHGTTIRVKSEVGKGSLFTFLLTTSQDHSQPQQSIRG